MFLTASALGATYLVYIQTAQAESGGCGGAGLRRVGHGGRSLALLLRPERDRHGADGGRSSGSLSFRACFSAVAHFFCAELPCARGRQPDGRRPVGVGARRGALCALLITRDPISGLEWIAIVSISSGVAVACLPARSGGRWPSSARCTHGSERRPPPEARYNRDVPLPFTPQPYDFSSRSRWSSSG
jgi:hypothetical protein